MVRKDGQISSRISSNGRGNATYVIGCWCESCPEQFFTQLRNYNPNVQRDIYITIWIYKKLQTFQENYWYIKQTLYFILKYHESLSLRTNVFETEIYPCINECILLRTFLLLRGWHLSKVKTTKEILFFVNEVKILTFIIILEYFKEDGTNFWTMTSQKVLEFPSHFVKAPYVTSHYICIKYCINQVCITWLRAVLIWMRTTSTTFLDSVTIHEKQGKSFGIFLIKYSHYWWIYEWKLSSSLVWEILYFLLNKWIIVLVSHTKVVWFCKLFYTLKFVPFF